MKYIELARLIHEKLALDTHNSDVLEYAILEKAKILGEFKNSGLRCRTEPDCHSNLILKKGESTSVVVFGFDNKSKEQEIKLNHIDAKIKKYILGSLEDEEAEYYKTFKQQTSFVIPNSSIKDAINSSSLVKASGNISRLNTKELNNLRSGVLLYKVNTNDEKLNTLMTELLKKIENLIENGSTASTTFSSKIVGFFKKLPGIRDKDVENNESLPSHGSL